jgi:putative membrane protein
VGEHTVWTTAVAAAFILGVSNLIIRPLLLLLAVPLGFIALFIVGFFVNAVVLRLTANILSPAFIVTNWFSAVLGSIVLSVLIGFVTALLNFDDENAFYEGVLQRHLARRPVELRRTRPRIIMLRSTA